MCDPPIDTGHALSHSLPVGLFILFILAVIFSPLGLASIFLFWLAAHWDEFK